MELKKSLKLFEGLFSYAESFFSYLGCSSCLVLFYFKGEIILSAGLGEFILRFPSIFEEVSKFSIGFSTLWTTKRGSSLTGDLFSYTFSGATGKGCIDSSYFINSSITFLLTAFNISKPPPIVLTVYSFGFLSGNPS